MNYQIIVYLISHILRLEAVFMVPALVISLLYKEHGTSAGFVLTILLLAVLSLPGLSRPPERKSFYAREGFVIVGLVWMIVSVFGALPFYVSGAIPNPVDCLFETVSGFTTTGASILTDVEALPMGLLYWRSFTHWLGGMGVLVFLLAILPLVNSGGNSLHLLRAESPGPQVGKLVPRMHETAKILYGIYVALTVVQILLLLAGGMPLFDSVCTAFGTAGTGGFGIKNDSIAGYSPYLQGVVTVFMALFGINFNIFYFLLIRDFTKALKNEELRTYLGIMFASIAAVTVNLVQTLGEPLGRAFRLASFQVASIMTTTGFATADFNAWPEFSRMILVLLMVVGASAGSTGGGIKCARILILWRAAKANIERMLHPRAVRRTAVDGETIDSETLNGVNVYMTFYCMIIAVSALLISLDNFSFETTFTATLSCLNNIGPGLDMVGPAGNYALFSNGSKLILTIDMLIGRLEIFPMLFLWIPSVWKR